MASILSSPTLDQSIISWKGRMDDEGHREYELVVQCYSGMNDGPATVLQTPGLPLPGYPWIIRADVDSWAWFYPTKDVVRHRDLGQGEKGLKKGVTPWHVTLKASTKPPGFRKCQDAKIEDPLFEPMKVSGGLKQYTEEATHDRFLRPLLYSSLEQIRGPAVEFAHGWNTIEIEQNVPFLELELCSAMQNTVNAYPLWGLPRRCVCLTDFHWEKKWWGQCYSYYTRRFTFEIRAKRDPFTGQVYSFWDKDIIDEGHKALNGRWENGRWIIENIDGNAPDPSNPLHFVRLTDKNGNLVKIPLNGSGVPAGQIMTIRRGGTGQYISKVNNNTGNPLTDASKWVLITSDIPPGVTQGSQWQWDRWTIYRKGNIVTWVNVVGFFNNADTGMYLRTGGNSTPDETSPAGQEEGPTEAGWLLLPNGAINRGNYDAATTYGIGEYVEDVVTNTDVLRKTNYYHHVEYYPEADHYLLGIPAIL